MWETPIHFSLFYNRAWASHRRRPERCFQTSVRSVSSCGKKSVKNGQVLGMDKAIREAKAGEEKQETELPREASEIKTIPLWHLPCQLYRVPTELKVKGHVYS